MLCEEACHLHFCFQLVFSIFLRYGLCTWSPPNRGTASKVCGNEHCFGCAFGHFGHIWGGARRAETRRLFLPLAKVTRTARGCCWMPAPTRMPRMRCVRVRVGGVCGVVWRCGGDELVSENACHLHFCLQFSYSTFLRCVFLHFECTESHRHGQMCSEISAVFRFFVKASIFGGNGED